MNVTIYGGINEIGGNKILVESGDTRVFLDFGTSMGYESIFFSEFLQPRNATGLHDRLEIGALPKISGIYRKDMFYPSGLDELHKTKYPRVLDSNSEYFSFNDMFSYEEFVEIKGRSFVDAVFLSHAHLDHTGAIEFLHPNIDLFCTSITKTLVKAIDDVTVFKSRAIDSKTNELGYTTDKSTFPNAPKIVHRTIKRACHTMEDMETVDIGDMKVTCIRQDHSVPGACSFLVESCGKRLLYTGDIRFHGSFPLSIDEYVEKVGSPVDCMICEGTRVDSEDILREVEIQKNIAEQLKQTKGVVFIDFSWKDISRYETIKKAAEEAGRVFVINARLAYLLHQLGEFPYDDEGVAVFLKRKYFCLYSPNDYSNSKHEFGFSLQWKKEGVDDTHYQDALIAKDIRMHPEHYVMMLSYFDLAQLFDLADETGTISGSYFIKAVCAPFSDEMELDERRLIHWLDMFGIGYKLGEKRIPPGCSDHQCEKIRNHLERAHVSGHASRSELKELIGKIKPKMLIPVHTEQAKEFDMIIEELQSSSRMIIPKTGAPISV